MALLPTLLFVALVTLALAATAYGLLQPRLQQEKKARSRLHQYRAGDGEKANGRQARDRVQEVARRRRTLEASLQELEQRQKQRHPGNLSLEKRIEQAGLRMSRTRFFVLGAAAGLFAGLLSLVLGASLWMAPGFAIVGGVGLPRWMLARLRKRRLARFTEQFADAVDVIVRGIKSGLPLNDTLRMIANDASEPVSSEFLRIVEAQQMGQSITESVERLYSSVPTAETNFFAIVVSIQSQAGGNLAEALGNLSRVLRERKKMKGKIQAMSMEAKASAYIIGSLPIIVGGLVSLTTPAYIAVLFHTGTGHMLLAASAVWMGIGIVVMRNMINFDF